MTLNLVRAGAFVDVASFLAATPLVDEAIMVDEAAKACATCTKRRSASDQHMSSAKLVQNQPV